MLLLSSGGNPLLIGAIAIISSLLIAIDSTRRKHRTGDDAVWIATRSSSRSSTSSFRA
jgi:hypothetical protein